MHKVLLQYLVIEPNVEGNILRSMFSDGYIFLRKYINLTGYFLRKCINKSK